MSASDLIALADALESDPFIDDCRWVGTSQQRARCEHYAAAALRSLSEKRKNDG